AFLLLFAVADPIISFAIYFSGWHSVRGLSRLGTVHGKSPSATILAATPMTLGAVAFALVVFSLLRGGNASDATVRTMFISLSAIAVPHLLLHGPISRWFENRAPRGGQFTNQLEASP
ncbi:MAG: Brp/Blh family beta-carotene 15,15'-dioxygenase, partial [Planctomycetota bacterium]